MPVVAMPDGTQVSFPDEMPPDQIKGLIAQKFPNEVKATAPQGFRGHAMDFLKSIPGGIVSGLGNALSATGEAAQAEMSQPIDFNPTPEQAAGALEQGVTGQLPKPQGVAGQYGRTLGEFIPNALLSPPGVGLGARAAQTVIPALATETAGQAASGTSAEGGARLAGTIGGSLLAGRGPKPIAAEEAAALARKSTPAPERTQLWGAATRDYKAAEAAGAEFSPQITDALADHITATLKDKNTRDYLAPGTFRAVDELRKEGANGNLADVRGVRQLLGELRQGGNKFERRAANIVIDEIDNFVARTEPEIGQTLGRANANYAAEKRAGQLDTAQEVAGLRTGRAGYGGNAVNAMRQVLSPIVEKAIKGKAQGYSHDEIAAMQEIVQGNGLTNTLRGIGQLSPSKGAIQSGLAMGSLGATGVIGAVANKLATVLTAKQVERLNELVRKRSPAYEEAVARSAQRYFDSAQEMANSPSHRALAKLVNASRGFSAGLKRDGIEVGSGDLIRQIQGPMRSGADNEQP